MRARIGDAVDLACNVLRGWGVPVRVRTSNAGIEPVGPDELGIKDYEEGRPVVEEHYK